MSKIEDDKEAFKVLKGIASKIKYFDVETFRDDFDKIANLPSLEYESLETRIKGMAPRGDPSFYNALIENIKKIIESTPTTDNKKEEFKNLTINRSGWFNKSKPITLRQLINFYLSITSERNLSRGKAHALEIVAAEDAKTRAAMAIQASVNNAMKKSANQKAKNAARLEAEAMKAEEAKRLNAERRMAEAREADAAEFLKAEAEEAEAAKAAAEEEKRRKEEARLEQLFKVGGSRRKSASKRNTRSKSKRRARKTRK